MATRRKNPQPTKQPKRTRKAVPFHFRSPTGSGRKRELLGAHGKMKYIGGKTGMYSVDRLGRRVTVSVQTKNRKGTLQWKAGGYHYYQDTAAAERAYKNLTSMAKAQRFLSRYGK